MHFTVNQIIEITQGELLSQSNISGTFGISTDTRTISINDIYLPLKGENFDGHDFIKNAVDKGARGYLINKENIKKLFEYETAKFTIAVDDTLEAYLKLAKYHKEQIKPITVAITGSSGKTTVKEMVYNILSQKYNVHKSKLNHNNEIGLCQTMLSIPKDTDFLVVEMGMRGLNEINLLSKYAKPDIAIITNIGKAHIGQLGSIEKIAQAKLEITNYLHKEGLFIAPYNEFLEKIKWQGSKVIFNDDSFKIIESSFKTVFKYKNETYKLNVAGKFNILNAICAIEVGLKAGVQVNLIKKGLEEYKHIENRWNIEKIDGFKVINDCYNANPESMKASVETAIDCIQKGLVVVLGDMKELGTDEKKYHKEIAEIFKDKNIKALVTIGDLAKLISDNIKNETIKTKNVKNNNEAIEFLKTILECNDTIFLKASRSMAFENIIEGLKN